MNMMLGGKVIRSLILLAAIASTGTAQADALIYESFSQTTGALNGKAAGTGFTGNWSSVTPNLIASPTLSYGTLTNAGNQVNVATGQASGNASAITSNVLSTTGLLNDGATLWFSVVTTGASGSNQHSGFAFGDAPLIPSFDGARLNGNAVGFYTRQGNVQAATWSPGGNLLPDSLSGALSAPQASTNFIVGRINWGANPGASETITLFTPSLANLLLPATSVSTSIAGFNQAALNIVSFASRQGPQSFDEIRFGARYVDVIAGATFYWDTNAGSAGTNAASVGNWTDTFWSQDPNGNSTTLHGWGSDNHAVFSAGVNGTGTQTITVTGTQNVATLTVQEGKVVLNDGGAGKINLNGGAGTATIASGSTLSGNVTIGGNVVGAGNIAPGLSPGEITIEGSFDMSGTYLWELGGYLDDNTGTAGVDWDLVSAGSADLTDLTLDVAFILSATDPDNGDPLFWNSDHTWLVVDSSVALTDNFLAITYQGGPVAFDAGTFSTFTDGNQAFLQFTSAAVPEPASIALWSLLGLVLVGCAACRARRKN